MATRFPTSNRAVEYFSMTAALKQFRQMCERDAGTSIDQVQVNAAEFLDDLAVHLGLSEARRAEILGWRGIAHVSLMNSSRVSLTVKH